MCLKYIRRAFDAYKECFRTIAGAQIIYFGIVFVLFSASILPLFAAGLGIIGNGGTLTSEAVSALVAPALFFLAGIFVTAVIAIALDAGRVGIYAFALQKKKPDVRVMFSVAGEKFWTVLGAAAIVIAITVAVAMLFIVPAMAAFAENTAAQVAVVFLDVVAIILFALLFSLIKQAIVIGNCGAVAAVSKSFRTVKDSYFEFALLAAIFVSASFILAAPLFGWLIALFVIQPLSELSYTAFYMEKAGKVSDAKRGKKPVKRKRHIRR